MHSFDRIRLSTVQNEAEREMIFKLLAQKCGNDVKRLSEEKFFVISAQNYYSDVDGSCCVAEISVVEFSFSKGISRSYHAVLKPGKILFMILYLNTVFSIVLSYIIHYSTL